MTYGLRLAGLSAMLLVGCASQPASPPGSAERRSGTDPASAPGAITSGPVVADAVALTAPESGSPAEEAGEGGPSVLAVHLRASGETAVNGERVSGLGDAAARAQKLKAAGAQGLRIVLVVDTGVGAERVAEALSRLREAGLKRVGVVMDRDEAPVAGAQTPSNPPSTRASLPEVAVENVGLHIGGGPNDEESKRPFREAIGARMADFRRCYKKVDRPGRGGIFGVDLRIGREGGRPEVREPRTGMGGPQFRACVLEVFRQVQFDKPRRGPTVISYSLRFTVGGQ
jgi:biopolymer transport protein ExbD